MKKSVIFCAVAALMVFAGCSEHKRFVKEYEDALNNGYRDIITASDKPFFLGFTWGMQYDDVKEHLKRLASIGDVEYVERNWRDHYYYVFKDVNAEKTFEILPFYSYGEEPYILYGLELFCKDLSVKQFHEEWDKYLHKQGFVGIGPITSTEDYDYNCISSFEKDPKRSIHDYFYMRGSKDFVWIQPGEEPGSCRFIMFDLERVWSYVKHDKLIL